jgi:hypothetical protein
VVKKEIFEPLAKSEKLTVSLHPASIGGGLTDQPERKTKNIFLLKIWKVKKPSYLCTPNHKQGLQTARKELKKYSSLCHFNWKRQSFFECWK